MDAGPVDRFERLYRSEVDAVTAYFARRSTDPETVADLVADTFVAAITSFSTFDPRVVLDVEADHSITVRSTKLPEGDTMLFATGMVDGGMTGITFVTDKPVPACVGPEGVPPSPTS